MPTELLFSRATHCSFTLDFPRTNASRVTSGRAPSYATKHCAASAIFTCGEQVEEFGNVSRATRRAFWQRGSGGNVSLQGLAGFVWRSQGLALAKLPAFGGV